jgi:hypothetical protein
MNHKLNTKEGKMCEPITRSIPEQALDDIYISLLDAYERLNNGKANIKRCLDYLENTHGYKPPAGYKEDNVSIHETSPQCSEYQCINYSALTKDCGLKHSRHSPECKIAMAIKY